MARESTALPELLHCLAVPVPPFLPIASSFQKDDCAHQRTPPIPPLAHIMPSPSSSSQTAIFFGSSRSNVVMPSCFSHTTTHSGCSEKQSTIMLECVVTIS